MKRAIVLSLVVLMSVGIMLPLSTNWSEASKNRVHRKNKKVKKYSRAWWKMYRAKLRRNRALAARKRALIARRANRSDSNKVVKVVPKNSTVVEAPIAGWRGESVSPNGETKYSVADSSGKSIGSAQLSVVGAAMPLPEGEMPAKMRDKTLAGVPVNSLRRTVIDKMIREEGWIVNDYQREVNGKKVFVVVAQSNGGGAVNSRLFYFTEVGGRIYNLSTNASTDYSDKIAADSEEFIQKLQRGTDQAEDVTATVSLK